MSEVLREGRTVYMTNEEYRKHPGLSRSELFVLNRSPFHFKYAQEHPQEETAALKFGTAIHCRILEPADFKDRYMVYPKFDRRTKEGRELYARWDREAASDSKILLSEEDYETVEEMAAQVEAHPIARQLLKGEHEVSIFWTDPDTNIQCKCRPDCLTEYNGQPLIVDYKSTDSCEDGHFERSCRKYGYRLQSGMYCEGLLQSRMTEYGFAFVAQEKKPPYAVRVYFCTPEFIGKGYDEFRYLLGLYKDCFLNNSWPGYGQSELCEE